ncbi:ferredoxin [Streptomyces sp. NPDC056716]|uniref:ferredoxin n=1 Tax=unclassified Streptomyces TaxID=2593676 RepID=UPI0036C7EB32
MPVLKADFGMCQGYANCVVAAPDTYDIDDDGVVVLLKDTIAAEDLPRVREAARSCPVSVLTIEDA